MVLITANELKRKLLISVRPTLCGPRRLLCFTDCARRGDDGAHQGAPPPDGRRRWRRASVQTRSLKSLMLSLRPRPFFTAIRTGLISMDEKTYEQFTFSAEAVGADAGYLTDGVSLEVLKYNGAPVSLQLPQFVELAVATAELGLRGDTAAGGATKQATLETGLAVRVPLFIKEGEVVRVNARTGEVAGRA